MVDKALLLAGDYLGSVWSLVETPTQIARIAYTFSLLGHIDKDSSFFKLHSVRREGRRHVYIVHSINTDYNNKIKHLLGIRPDTRS